VTRVLVTSIGASPAIDVARSLRLDPSVRITGADAGGWGRRLGETLCDEVVALPPARPDAEAYVRALVEAAARVDFVFLGLDLEIAALAAVGRALPVPTALARLSVLPILLDKAETERAGRASGVLPATVRFRGVEDLDAVFEALPPPIWVRPSAGTSGKGSLNVLSRAHASAWLQAMTAVGSRDEWIAQEFLPGRNLNWSGVLVEGEVVAWASMERLEYLLGEVAPSGVTGQVKRCQTVVLPHANEAAERVVRAIDPRPHGVYSVDLREDAAGAAKVTEVNPRLAGRPLLYARAGVNLPLAALRALRGRPVGDAVAAGGLRPHLQMYRQVDVEPLIADAP
jgi:carbamoyl-phosphate synthase large subunit